MNPKRLPHPIFLSLLPTLVDLTGLVMGLARSVLFVFWFLPAVTFWGAVVLAFLAPEEYRAVVQELVGNPAAVRTTAHAGLLIAVPFFLAKNLIVWAAKPWAPSSKDLDGASP